MDLFRAFLKITGERRLPSTVKQRVLSGMRPTGRLHLGHYHGVLKNWLALQQEYECFFFVADWHALTTEYERPAVIEQSVWDMIIDWLAVGINPGAARLFIQSRVPEHAELHLLLSMSTPLSWLERVPSYKDQQEKLAGKDLTTYGFLGYPLLQTADIIIYKAGHVPVGEDQVSHVELAREVARRFNHLYGREPDFEERVEAALKKWAKRTPVFTIACGAIIRKRARRRRWKRPAPCSKRSKISASATASGCRVIWTARARPSSRNPGRC